MNDRTRTTRIRVARAVTGATALLLPLAAIAAPGFAMAAPGGGGAIWTTIAPCDEPAAQNVNLYAIGETVYIRGDGFDADASFDWTITGQPGGASGDPDAVVASGAGTTDAAGEMCVEAYPVAADDWGVYTVDLDQGGASKNDNYRVARSDDQPTDDPADDPADDPGDEPPGDETPGDEPSGETPTDEPTDETPTDETPTDETPTDETPTDETPTDETPTDETPGDEPVQEVGGEVDVNEETGGGEPDPEVADSTTGDPQIELPPTDTIDGLDRTGSPLLVIGGLAALAGATVLLIPSRRRDPEATA